ncbi:flavin reductase family protein [Pseudahrensia aquimaris]|uniref:Flavin reductase family protein n=1 Tax=Pseudahrensia aquimaris TaxID=744461 RepID=A0ABW3FDR9_9HYPH
MTTTEDTIEVQRPRAEMLTPSADNQRAYRNALGAFATGVTIITANGSNGPIGMTVNSFASVSLDPALVLWSLAKSSGRYPSFAEAKHFAIHVLERDQQDLALAFAKDGAAFHCCEWELDANGVPLIENTVARFDCTTSAAHDAGDHLIIVGQVHSFVKNHGEALVFADGAFGGFHTGG